MALMGWMLLMVVAMTMVMMVVIVMLMASDGANECACRVLRHGRISRTS